MEYYPRKIEKKIEKWMKRKEIILIKGPRQSGKTTLLLHLKEKFGGSYVTLEDDEMLNSFEASPKEFASRFIKGKKSILFLDEAQYSPSAGKKLKLIYDLFSDKLKLCVTGSGSFDIKVEVGKYLVGRGIYFELFPLSFEEFLMWKAKDLVNLFAEYKESVKKFILGKPLKVSPAFTNEFRSLLEEYIIFGGFPAIVKEKSKEIKIELLKNLVRTYLEKDVFFFFNIRHFEKFKKFISFLSFNTGSILDLASITRELGMDYKTAENYLSILSNTYIISLLSPFHKNLVTELKKAKKLYFFDTGLRNSVMGNFLPLHKRGDKGKLFENFIFNELREFGEVRYWRTTGKAEVDFVINLKNRIVPVEVKSQGKPTRGFMSFLKTYKPKRAIVFTEKRFEIKKIGNTQVAFIPHFFI